MNGTATFGDEIVDQPSVFCSAQLDALRGLAREEPMTSAMAAFGIAVGGTSLICYALMTRLQNARRKRPSSGDSSGTAGGNFAAGDDWSILNWFGGDHSATDSSGNPANAGGAIAAMAVTAVVEATDAASLRRSRWILICRSGEF